MNKLRWFLWGIILLLWIVASIYLVRSVIAYPGGTALSMQQEGFSWSENLFLELGRLEAYNLESNEQAEGFWVKFLLLSGIGMTILHLMWLLNMTVHQARLWAGAAFLFVGLGAFHSYGLRLYPFDTAFLKFQVFWERMAGAYALGAVATGIAMKIEPKCKSFHAYSWWFVGLIALIFWSLMKWGPAMWSSHAILTTYAILEKVVFIAFVIVWLMHLRLRYNRLRTKPKPSAASSVNL